jgi:DEAD/DEAH box helicase domain-containing protein
MAGYPGTIASTWQRSGRAGRRQSTSLAVLVASSAPVDQFIIEHPEYFFGQSPEHAYVNPDNVEILISHMKCAAFELPVQDGEKFGGHDAAELCAFLRENGLVHEAGGAWHWTSDTYPADAISLRSVSSDNFVVVDETGEPRIIGEVPFPAAPEELHEKAIYLHEARQYQVERLDFENRKAYVRRVESDYYTDAIEYTQVKEIDRFDSAPMSSAFARHGEVRVNRQVVGFKKIKFYTNENVGAGHLSLPEQELHTTAFWLHFPEAFLARFPELSPTEIQAGLTGMGRAMQAVGALLLMCDARDLGVALTEDVDAKPRVYEPSLFLYDNYPGGVGLSLPLFELRGKLVEMSGELIRRCECESGCPSCVGPLGEVGERGKESAVRILAELVKSVVALP